MKNRPDSSVLLQVNGLQAWYGAAQVLFDVSLNVRQGEIVALMGRNGAGKTTSLMAIMGMLARVAGKIQFMGESIAHWPVYRIARLGLGFVPEDRRIFTDLSVEENLLMGRQPERHWPDGRAAPHWTLESVYELFPVLAAMRRRMGGQMSGGEQQMLTVARSLMGNPYLLLLDEPTEGVAPIIVEQIADMLLQLKEQGVSVLLSEQNMHFAGRVAQRAYVLEQGQIRYSGAMAQLASDHQLQQQYLSI